VTRAGRAALSASLLCFLAACGGDSSSPAAPDTPASANAVSMRLLAQLDLGALTGQAASACHPGHCDGAGDAGVARGSGNWGYTSRSGRRVALTGTSLGLSIDEVTTPTRPRHRALIGAPASSWREVKTYGDFAYVTTEAVHGLDVVDLRDLDHPVKVQTWSETFASAHTLCVDEARGLLFVNGTRTASHADSGMRVLSVSEDPAHPREIGAFTSFYVHDCVVRGNTLYASAIYGGFLAVLDISDPARPRETTRFSTGRRFTHNSWPTFDGRYLFTTDEVAGAPLEGWDITDLQRPTKVSEYLGKTSTAPHNVLVDGNRLLVAHYLDGVHLLDIADPARPRLLGRYDTFPDDPAGVVFDGVWAAYIFPGTNLIVASDISNGLFVLEYTGR
jgi:choice-of-anchor B domain-containing protein